MNLASRLHLVSGWTSIVRRYFTESLQLPLGGGGSYLFCKLRKLRFRRLGVLHKISRQEGGGAGREQVCLTPLSAVISRGRTARATRGSREARLAGGSGL